MEREEFIRHASEQGIPYFGPTSLRVHALTICNSMAIVDGRGIKAWESRTTWFKEHSIFSF